MAGGSNDSPPTVSPPPLLPLALLPRRWLVLRVLARAAGLRLVVAAGLLSEGVAGDTQRLAQGNDGIPPRQAAPLLQIADASLGLESRALGQLLPAQAGR